TNCNIEGGDDAIAIKSDGGKLGEDRPCENVVVSNCILSSPPACAVRVGYEGDSPIKNCTFSNLAIYKSHHGIDVVSVLAKRDPPFQMLKGTRIEGIQFNDVIMDDVIQPIYLWMGNEQKDMESSVSMKNIRISNLTATNSGDSFIGSSFEKNIENINLSNIHIESIKSFPENTNFYNNVWGSEYPYTFYFKNISGLHINELCVDFSDSVEYWKHAVYFEKSKDVFLSNFSVKGYEKIKLISQIGVSNSSIQLYGFTKEEGPKFIFSDDNSQIIIKN
ncbi:MAG: glycosyl hydrolase family 28 protein, partial [Bacteroidales bacterium]|nr:glycosyl hydrolase family 28 protein [Bacteroidales bacterium]